MRQIRAAAPLNARRIAEPGGEVVTLARTGFARRPEAPQIVLARLIADLGRGLLWLRREGRARSFGTPYRGSILRSMSFLAPKCPRIPRTFASASFGFSSRAQRNIAAASAKKSNPPI